MNISTYSKFNGIILTEEKNGSRRSLKFNNRLAARLLRLLTPLSVYGRLEKSGQHCPAFTASQNTLQTLQNARPA